MHCSTFFRVAVCTPHSSPCSVPSCSPNRSRHGALVDVPGRQQAQRLLPGLRAQEVLQVGQLQGQAGRAGASAVGWQGGAKWRASTEQ